MWRLYKWTSSNTRPNLITLTLKPDDVSFALTYSLFGMRCKITGSHTNMHKSFTYTHSSKPHDINWCPWIQRNNYIQIMCEWKMQINASELKITGDYSNCSDFFFFFMRKVVQTEQENLTKKPQVSTYLSYVVCGHFYMLWRLTWQAHVVFVVKCSIES